MLFRSVSQSRYEKLGTYSRKNKLYLAFRELGRVIRTIYLMKYISDVELRSTIQAATNKSEGFNGFAKWIAFGNDGVIRENSIFKSLHNSPYKSFWEIQVRFR